MSEIWSSQFPNTTHQINVRNEQNQTWVVNASNLSSEFSPLSQVSTSAVSAVCGVLMDDFASNDIVPWHSDIHAETRMIMKQCISHLILQRKPDSDVNWISKLPDVAQRIEKQLYFSAKSIQEYSDPYTLIERLQSLVKSLISQSEKRGGVNCSSRATAATATQRPQQQQNFVAPASERSAPFSQSSSFAPESYMSSVPYLPFFSQPSISSADVASNSNSSYLSMMPPPPHLLPSFAGASSYISSSSSSSMPLPQSSMMYHPQQIGFVPPPPLQQQSQHNMFVPPPPPFPSHELQSNSASEMSGAMSNSLASRQVSCQGCSRVFIVKVLVYMSEYVKGKQMPSIFTFKRALVMSWLGDAKEQCCDADSFISEDAYFGGPGFIEADGSTYWSEPNQLFTWWKNNVERKSKFKIMQEDMLYQGNDHRKIQRSRWCEAVVALAEVIRTSSGSVSARAAKELQSAAVLAAEKISNGGPVMLPHALNAPGAYPETEALSIVRAVILNREQQRLQHDASGTAPSTTSSVSSLADCESTSCTSNPATPLEGDSNVRNPQFFNQSGLHNSTGLQGVTGCAFSPNSSRPQSSDVVLADNMIAVLGVPTLPLMGFPPPSLQQPLAEAPVDNDPGFPAKLFDLVSGADQTVVGWREDGLALVVRDLERFTEEVLRKHFNHNSFATFQRQLNRHGFRRCNSADKGVYQHPQFLKGHREMAELILCVFFEPPVNAPLTLTATAAPPFLGNAVPVITGGYSFNYSQQQQMGNGAGYNPPLYGAAMPFTSSYGAMGGPPTFNAIYPGYESHPGGGLYSAGGPAFSKFNAPFNPYAPSTSWNGMSSNNAYFCAPFIGAQSSSYSSSVPMKALPPRVVRVYKGRGDKKKKPPAASTASTVLQQPQSAEQFLDRMPRSERYDHEEETPSPSTKQKKVPNSKRVSKATLQHNLLRLAFGGGGDKQSSAVSAESTKRKYKTRVAAVGKVRGSYRKKRSVAPVSDSSDGEREEDEDEEEASWMAQIEAQAALKTAAKIKKKITKTKSRTTSPAPAVRVTAIKSGKSLSAKKQLLATTGLAAEIEEVKLSEFVRETSRHNRLPASKQSSADGTIEPFRPDYTTSGRNRLDRIRHRTSNAANVCDRFGVIKDSVASVSVGLGRNHQADIPELVLSEDRLSEWGGEGAAEGLVWSAPADGSPDGLTPGFVSDYLARTKAESLRNPVAVGTVLVVFIEELNAYRLCCVLDVHNADEFDRIDDEEENANEKQDGGLSDSSVRVFDGYEEYLIHLDHADGFQHRHEDVLLQRLFSQRSASGSGDVTNSDDEAQDVPTWSAADVKTFCSAVGRFGDNIRKIWLLTRLKSHKTLPQVLEFFHRVYPHTMQGDSNRLVAIHHRAELASAGYPDGLDSSSSSSSSSSEAEEGSAEGDDLVSLEDLEDNPLSSGEDGDGDEQGEEEEELNGDESSAHVLFVSRGQDLSQHTERDEEESKGSKGVTRSVEKRKRVEQTVSQPAVPAVRSSGRTKREKRDI